MKRLLLVFVLLCFVSTIFAAEEYNIYLKDGKVIKSDSKPDFKGDRIYFERFGMILYLSVDLVDVKKTQSGGTITSGVAKEIKKTKKVRKVTEEDLEKVRERSRLANEEELLSPTEEGGGSAVAASAPQQGGDQIKSLQDKLNSLMNQRSTIQGEVTSLMQELSNKKDQYGFATLAADKERLQKEIDDIQNRLNDAKSKLSSVENMILATQQEIASTPIVLEVPTAPPKQTGGESTPPPPPPEEGQ